MYIAMEGYNILDTIDKMIDYAGRHYAYLDIILYTSYIILFIGIIKINPIYVSDLHFIMQIIVCVILIYRFNPFRTHELKKYDANIIFSSAIFLLFNTGIVKIFEQYWKEVPLDKAVAMLEKLDKEKLLDM